MTWVFARLRRILTASPHREYEATFLCCLFAVVGGGHPEPNKVPKNLILIKASMGPLWFET